MGVSWVLTVLGLAALVPFVHERWRTLSALPANAPDRLVKINKLGSYQIRFADRIRSCEDALMLEEHGLALLACDAGRERWNTVLGIFAGPVASAELYVYDYKATGVPDSEALRSVELANFEASVVHVKVRGGQVEAKVVARVPFANGIEMVNSTTMAVASTSRAAVYLYTVAHEPVRWHYHSQLRVPFLPDNLSLSGGKLLIVGHGHFVLFKFAETRRICNNAAELANAPSDLKAYCTRGTAVSCVSEWSEAHGLRHIYADTHYPSSTTAVRDARRGVGIIVGLYARGLLAWRE